MDICIVDALVLVNMWYSIVCYLPTLTLVFLTLNSILRLLAPFRKLRRFRHLVLDGLKVIGCCSGAMAERDK